MALRIMDYLTKHSVLSHSQYGFRPKYSTELAVYELTQNMYDTIDNGKYQITILCDLAKAFDTVSHSILLEKLKIYGIRGKANDWFKSYLSHRQQYTVFNNKRSTCKDVKYGVPQGSILGPLLFLLYINDITNTSKKLKFLLFADDTNIFIKGNDVNELTAILNQELIHVSN